MKNFILGVLTVLIIGGVAYGAYHLGTQSKKPLVVPTATPTAMPQGSSSPAVTTTPEPSVTAQSDMQRIKAALFAKNKWPQDLDVSLTMSTNDGTYASGTVASQGGGGYFYAKKVSGDWVIVADGNGMITCDSLKAYPDYPNTLISDCYIESTGAIIKR